MNHVIECYVLKACYSAGAGAGVDVDKKLLERLCDMTNAAEFQCLMSHQVVTWIMIDQTRATTPLGTQMVSPLGQHHYGVYA